jgi:hypothetical protein
MGLGKTALVAMAGCAMALAGCSSSPTTRQSISPTTSPSKHSTTTTAQTAPNATTTTSTTGTPQNLTVTNQLRASLVAAFAAAHMLVASDYTGLAPGRTYYAYDPSTMTYWAGASVQPSSSSVPAQVSAQDDGSYAIFSMPSGDAWNVADVGATGEQGSSCPANTIPASIVALWNWTPGSCLPPN